MCGVCRLLFLLFIAVLTRFKRNNKTTTTIILSVLIKEITYIHSTFDITIATFCWRTKIDYSFDFPIHCECVFFYCFSSSITRYAHSFACYYVVCYSSFVCLILGHYPNAQFRLGVSEGRVLYLYDKGKI